MEKNDLDFDPSPYTTGQLHSEAWIHFTASPALVFARIADHPAMTDWVPLLKTVRLTPPPASSPDTSPLGTKRDLVFIAGVTFHEELVYWDAPHSYAYTTHGAFFPLQAYVGWMGVTPLPAGGGKFIFRQYYTLTGTLWESFRRRVFLWLVNRAMGNLSKRIGGTDYGVHIL